MVADILCIFLGRNAEVGCTIATLFPTVRFQMLLVVATMTLWWMGGEMVGWVDAGTQLSFGEQGASFLYDGAPGSSKV